MALLVIGRYAATEFIIKVNYEIYGLGQQREADFYERREGYIFWGGVFALHSSAPVRHLRRKKW